MNDNNQLDDFFSFKTPKHEEKHKENLKEIIVKKLSGKVKLKLLPRVLSKKERHVIVGLCALILGSIIAIPITTFLHFTETNAAYGGSFSEGIVGEPRYINPLLAQTNDADRDLVTLVYSSLMKYNEEGKLVPDLAKSYEISTDGLNYTVYLKEGSHWHDGRTVTADDVIYTITTAQNSDYGSLLRINWQGVEVEKISDYTVIFKLKNKYAQFLNNLTIRILPKHVWQNVKPINFALSEFNLKPIGSGPYKFDRLKKDKFGQITSYEVVANRDYYNGRAYIDKIELKFFPSEDAMIEAYNKNGVDGISFISAENKEKLRFKQRLSIRQLKLPRYFATFFNQNQSKILSDKNVRLALSHGTDKESIINKILDNEGLIVSSPMIGEVLDINKDVKTYAYDPENAKDILKTAGWTTEENGFLKKKDELLSLKLTTSTWPELTMVASMLKEQWAKIGLELVIEVLPTPELQQAIKERNYQILLFGEILNIDPDPFSLWHSSQKREPGLNLALYDNKGADKLLEEARQTLNPIERSQKYDEFQKLVVEDIPAIFLYNPFYLYAQAKRINGFESAIISMPSDRFANIERWYIETERSLDR